MSESVRALTRRRLARLVGDTEQPDSPSGRLDHSGSAGRLDASSCSGGGNAGVPQQLERFRQRLLLVVERMIVGERDRANPDPLERLDRRGRRAEVERLAADSPGALPPRGDAALEVADDEIQGPAERAQFVAPKL
jgi:hypothetical protein